MPGPTPTMPAWYRPKPPKQQKRTTPTTPNTIPAWLQTYPAVAGALSATLPAWLRPKKQPTTTTTPYNYNAAPVQQTTPTGSFIGGGGQYALGSNQQPVSTNVPTGSFLGGNGQYVLGSNQQAYMLNRRPGPNTFIGAGGEAVRGPDIPIANVPPPTSGGGGGGGGYGYRRRGRGGGGGWQPPAQEQPTGYVRDQAPAWLQGLANWTIG